MKNKSKKSAWLYAALCLLLVWVGIESAVAQTTPTDNWIDYADVNWAADYNNSNPGQTAFVVEDEGDLAQLAVKVNSGLTFEGKTITLNKDLDLSAHEWTPIGGSGNPFKGTFNGQGHKITGLIIINGDQNQGLFGSIENATIQDLEVKVTITGEVAIVGSIAGDAKGNSSISNCYSSGTVSGVGGIGGIAGKLEVSGTISNCHSSTEVSGSQMIGGIVGGLLAGTISNCSNTGKVIGTDLGKGRIGGIAGYVGVKDGSPKYRIISNCYNTGKVSGTHYVGGISGLYDGKSINCYNTGQISGSESVGGIIGSIQSGGTISYCYNTGTVSRSSGTDKSVGDIVGDLNDGNIEYCAYLKGSSNTGIGTNNKPEIDNPSSETAHVLADLMNTVMIPDENGPWKAGASIDRTSAKGPLTMPQLKTAKTKAPTVDVTLYKLTLTKPTNAKVTIEPDGTYFDEGETVSLTAANSDKYEFLNFTSTTKGVDIQPLDKMKATFKMPQGPVEITANFKSTLPLEEAAAALAIDEATSGTPNENGWYSGSEGLNVKIPAGFEASLDGQNWYENSLNIQKEGEYTQKVLIRRVGGKQTESKTIEVKLDFTAPSIGLDHLHSLSAFFRISDNASGVMSYTFDEETPSVGLRSANGAPETRTADANLVEWRGKDGVNKVRIKAIDYAGNIATQTFQFDLAYIGWNVILPENPLAYIVPDPGTYTVEDGDSFVFRLNPRRGHDLAHIQVSVENGEILQGEKGRFIIDHVTSDMNILINPYSPTGNEEIEITEFGVRTANGTLAIDSPTRTNVQIIDPSGRVLRSLEISAGTTYCTGLSKGVYIVRSTLGTVKIAL